jgi:hypothetical protein
VIDHNNGSIGVRHHIKIGPRVFDLTELASGTRIAPLGERGLYAIGAGRRVEIFADFGRFTTRLSEKFGGGSKAVSMSASGGYDRANNTLNAREVHITLTN